MTSTRQLASALFGIAIAAGLILLPPSSFAAEIVYSDGRREAVKDPRADSKGNWTAELEGRRTMLKPGDVVVIVDDDGKETVTIPELGDEPAKPETEAALASLKDVKNPMWMESAERLGMQPIRATHDALVALAQDSKKELRRHAVFALARLRTKESVMAASAAVLAEKDKTLRRELASVLFSVQEIFMRCESAAAVAAGIADKDSGVRFVYAMLAPPDLEAARVVLRGSDGMKNSDHHVRESAAVELGLRGDGAGESVLIGMLARNKIPGLGADDALNERLLIEEHVRICGILGKLGTAPGKAALEKAKSSKHEAVRTAAEKALAK